MLMLRRAFSGFLLAACVPSVEAHAQFTPRPANPTPVTTPDSAIISWDWAFTLGRNELSTGFGAPNWFIAPSSPAAAAGVTSKVVDISLQHLVRPAGHAVTEPVPNTRADINLVSLFSRVQIPRISTLAFVQQHGNQGHADVYDLRITEPALAGRPGRFVVTAEHLARATATWSFTPMPRAGAYVVTASYPSDPNERQDPPATAPRQTNPFGAPSGPQRGTLNPSTPTGQQPTDWILEVAYNPRTVTTLAYVVITEGGRFDKAELGMMTKFFLDEREYLAPVLLDTQGEDLHVAIDLTQWVTSETPFEQGEEIDVLEGVTDRLPGFLVARSPIRFDPSVGFASDDPFSGTVTVGGTIDGGIGQETGRAFLLLFILIALLLAVAALVVFRRRSGRVAG